MAKTGKRPSKKNVYTHEIDLKDLSIQNAPRDEFREKLEKIEYRGYKVEDLKDGKKIVITKPGGKFTFGVIKREDFMVWVYNPIKKTLWLISHKNIWEDLKKKGKVNKKEALNIIDALERVLKGEEPEKVLESTTLNNPIGESPELLFKAYKWIWGQEDINYPDGEGRNMSWEQIVKLKNSLLNKSTSE